MCAILFFYSKKVQLEASKFKSALNLMEHRGPDGSHIFMQSESNKTTLCKVSSQPDPSQSSNLLVGHNRLAIFDLSSSSDQPFTTSDRSLFLSYNGEFYNFKEYAKSQKENSDGRTLFQELCSSSVEAFDRVNGMWAAIFGDLKNGKVYLSRDRYGKKPLYYYYHDGTLIAGSEPKSLFFILSHLGLTSKKRKVTIDGLTRFLLGKLTPFSTNGIDFYQLIKSVAPGSNLVFDLNNPSIEKYSDVIWSEFKDPTSLYLPNNNAELVEAIRADLKDSIRLRLQADTKVAIMLSGGIDSSFIVGSAAELLEKEQIHLFTAHIFSSLGEPNADLGLSRETAKSLGLDLNEVVPNDHSEESLVATILEITKYMELPVNPQLSCMPTFMLTKAMAEKGIKVCLDGIGADEVFGGYSSHLHLALANAQHGSIISMLRHFGNFSQATNGSYAETLITFLKVLRRYFLKRGQHNSMVGATLKLIQNIGDQSILRKANELDQDLFKRDNFCTMTERQEFDLMSYQIPYYLGVADACSMANSVENRSPFLDYRLIKYINIKDQQKSANGLNKISLRAAMPNNIPEKITKNIKKYGMGTSFKSRTFKKAETLELLAASDFVTSLTSMDTLVKEFNNETYSIQQFVSLAALDEVYGIEL